MLTTSESLSSPENNMLLYRSKVVALLLFINACNSAITKVPKKQYCTCDWMKHVFNYISKNLHPPQVTIFVPESKNEEFYHANHIQKIIVGSVSTLIVNTRKCDEKHPIFNMSAFEDPRRTNFYVLLYRSENLMNEQTPDGAEELEGIFNLMANIAPKPSRPRCLLILFGTKTVDDEVVESISLYAWTKKFLDLTILVSFQNVSIAALNDEWIQKDIVTYHYYNPFLKKHYSGYYEEKIDLFPDKLYNFHGYTFNVAATNNPPYVILARNETGYPILSREGSNFRTLRILSHKLNFKYEFAPSSFEDYTEGNNNSLFNRLVNGEINFSTNHLFIRKTAAHFTSLEKSIITTTEVYTALVPVIVNKQVKLPQEFVFHMCIATVMILIFYLLIHILRFDQHYWSCTIILEILFNASVFSQPKVWSERIIFLCITYLAFTYSVTFITQMTEVQFLPQDVESHELATFGKLGYTPVILEQFRDLTLEQEIEDNEEFKARLQVFRAPADCSARLEKGEKIVCFMTKFIGEKLIKEAKEKKLVPKMTLLKNQLWESWKCILFERGSPVVKGINRVLERLRDSGLLNRFVYDVTYHRDINSQVTEAEILSKKIITIEQLMTELIVGYIIAFIVLGLELIHHRFEKSIRKFRKRLKISYWDRRLPIRKRWN